MPVPGDFEPVVTVKLKSWREFKLKLFDEVRRIQAYHWPSRATDRSQRFMFRGQACASWPLWSSFDRLMESNKIVGGEVERLYTSMLKDFMVQGSEMDMLEPEMRLSPEADVRARFKDKPADLLHVESFAQHQGLATRLLDWSHSPYVAAFFALCEPEKCNSGAVAVWCLDIDGTRELFEDKDIVVIDRMQRTAQRMLWQRGGFTTNRTNLTRVDEVFLRANKKLRVEPKYPVLFKFVMPAKVAEEALQDLEMMRINFLSVYPDIQGLVKYASHRLSIRMRGGS